MKILNALLLILVISLFIGGTVVATAQNITNSDFGNIKHTLQIHYYDKASSSLLGQYHYDSSRYFSEIYLLPGRCYIYKKKKEFQLEAFVWVTNGISKTQGLDTLALENFEVFLATPVNGELLDKRIVATNCGRQQHNNGFNIKVKLKETDRLYITNCSTDLLQEWEVGKLVTKKKDNR